MSGIFNLTAEEKRQKFLAEIKDLLTGAAFPVMLTIIFSASIIVFADMDDKILGTVILVIGELFIIASCLIFGRQNGIAASRRLSQNAKKRELNSTDKSVIYKTGEYAAYKGFVIGFLSCVPFILIQLINCILPNSFCEFLLKYAFGWAFYPFNFLSLSPWLNFLWVVPFVCVHAGGYFWGAYAERKRQEKIISAQTEIRK